MTEGTDARFFAAGVVVGGAYRVLRPLAEGGMGLIYDVEELATGARRSLEVMRGQFGGDDELAARLLRETRLAAAIPSEHAARALDAGCDEASGALYVVTEPLDGTTLASVLIHSGAFPWTAALTVLEQVAHALGAAHARGLVHGHLGPSTIFLVRSGRDGLPFAVKVLDFGVSKALAAAVAPGQDAPAWTAPEQLAPGAAVRLQADVWSFGLLSFVLLSGKHYFPSANLPSSSAAAVTREALIDDLAPASQRASRLGVGERLPPHYDEWFRRCVHRDPGSRFYDIGLAHRELARLARRASVAPPPVPRSGPMDGGPKGRSHPPTTLSAAQPPPPPSRWTAPVGFAVAAMVGALVALLFVVRIRPVRDVATRATMSVPPVAAARVIRLHGSNTIGAELAPALAEAFLRRSTGVETVVRRSAPDELSVEARDGSRTIESVEIAAHGSATAFEDLAAGRCDIGMASRRIKDDEAAKLTGLGDLTSAATEHVIALDGIAVIVNPINPIASLTKRQIGDIFAGNLHRWSDVYWKADPIVVHARDDRSGTYDTFRQLVLQGRPLIAGARRHESSEELSDAVAADPNAIGFIGLPYVRSAKAIMVQEEGSVALLPSSLTVSTEDYPLTRRLYFYAPLGAPLAVRDFIDFAQSEDGQRVVESAGFVDLRPECDPNAARCTSCTPGYHALVAGGCRVSFDFRFVRGSAQLDTRGLRDLQRITSLMQHPEYSAKSLTLLGFSDATGTRADNLGLSAQRASIVATQLRARGLQVEVEQGLGADMPISDNASDEGRERNRRVEVWLR